MVTLRSPLIDVEVLPGKGGDILSIQRRPDGGNLLWSTPWGLRPRGALGAAVDSAGKVMEGYAGGWQTVFPNGGAATARHGTTWGMHGEVWLTPFRYTLADPDGIEMTATLVHSPFDVRKTVRVEDARVVVEESVTNRGGIEVEVMWSHHPAFGPPLLSASSRLETTATRVICDSEVPEGRSDIVSGALAAWPHVPADDGGTTDLRRIPGPASGIGRMAYLTGFDEGFIHLRNPDIQTGVLLRWDADLMPYAWYWFEAAATASSPWYKRAYVLGLEPATSIPGLGAAVAEESGTTVRIASGQTLTARISLEVTDGARRLV
ncbi:DUF4432 family protein [Microbacterium sp.]|uniref:DUF4432 family protein n=1 Tax=Microbacterium sp. TaxID=51671 RepID=UPI003F9917E5